MKFCLSSRQTPEYLKQADEIRVASRDYKQIYDLIEQYPNATIILNYTPSPEEKEKYNKAVRDFVMLAPKRFILCLFSLADVAFAKELNIPFFSARPITTLEQLRTIKELGVCYAIIDNQICHQLHETKIIGVPLRLFPNISFLDDLPRENGICGNWIRPEDVEAYSLYIDVLEFGSRQPEKREQALFRIYAKEHQWSGDLGRLVEDLNALGQNSLIDSKVSQRRMNCGMLCATSKNCTLCYDMLKIASHPELFNKESEN